MRKFTVALVAPPITGHHHRGTGVYVSNLYKSLRKRSDLECLQVEYGKIPDTVDVIHYPYFDPFFLTLPLFHKKPVVVTIHDLIPIKFSDHFPVGIRGTIKWYIQKTIVARMNHIITDSKASRDDIIDIIGVAKDKVSHIYLAPGDEYTSSTRVHGLNTIHKKLNIPDRYILFVGEPNWNKNLPRVIEVSEKSNIPLVIVSKTLGKRTSSGHPWESDLVIALNKLKNPLIHVCSDLAISDLRVLYASARCLIYPSFYEGFGLPIIEAFASKCPVITTQRGSLKEAAGDAAIFVNPTDIDDMMSALRKIDSNDRFRKELIEKGKRQAEKFSWVKTAQQTTDIYKNIVLK